MATDPMSLAASPEPAARKIKPAWNVPANPPAAVAAMGAATWPSLGAATPAKLAPKSGGTTTNSSSSDSLKSLSDGSAGGVSVIQKAVPSPDTVLVQTSPAPNPKLNSNPNNPNPNPTRHSNPNPNPNPNNRSSKWNNNTNTNTNNNRRYNNNNNNYHHNNNNNYRGRDKPNWNHNNGSNNSNSWGNNNNGGNNANSLHQRPQHFFRPNPAVTGPPPPPVSFGFSAPPVPPAFYSPIGFPEFPFAVMGHMPLLAAGPGPGPGAGPAQFIPQLAPNPVMLSAAELDRRTAILKQIEYYFSTENLCKDVYLRKNMDEQGWVPISLIAGFNRVKQLSTDMQYILDVIQGSSVLEVQGDKIRARNNWMNWVFTERMQGLNITPPLTTGRNT